MIGGRQTDREENMAKKKKYYSVAAGRIPGIYTEWFGKNGAHVQVTGFPGARFKGFLSRREAEAFLKAPAVRKRTTRTKKAKTAIKTGSAVSPADAGGVALYTDGGARPTNPGPGGYGVVLIEKGSRREFSGGFRYTTNNRMEILACVVGLEALEAPMAITLHSDSKYVVNGITRGWARNWQKNGWKKSDKKPALNPDLWQQLLLQCEKHDVTFVWVKGHAGNPENERCDQLATAMALAGDLPPDRAYEKTTAP